MNFDEKYPNAAINIEPEGEDVFSYRIEVGRVPIVNRHRMGIHKLLRLGCVARNARIRHG